MHTVYIFLHCTNLFFCRRVLFSSVHRIIVVKCCQPQATEGHVQRSAGRRSNRQCLLPLPPRSVPPQMPDKYVSNVNRGSAPAQCSTAPSKPENTPYFDALVRCFLLGVVSGGLFESYGALTTIWGMSAQTSNVWSMAKAAYPPQFVVDHVIGVCVLAVLYASECFGLRQATLTSKRTLGSFLAALPKALIPVNFTALKSQLPVAVTDLKSQLANLPADLQSNKSAITATLEAPTDAREVGKIDPRTAGASASGSGSTTQEPSPFVPDCAARPDLAPGQWNLSDLGGAVQEEAAKQCYLEGMYYCIGTVPWNGIQTGKIYDAYVLGTRVAYWKSAVLFCMPSYVHVHFRGSSGQGDDGKINTISSTCTHRGAQLASGWIDEVDGKTCVRCPYHAWAFDGDGVVKDIPVQPEGGYPKRPLQQSFETFEEDSKMWVFWGRPQIPVEERPPVPGSVVDAMEGMLSTTWSATYDAPHQNTMEALASEKSLAACASTLLGVTDCNIEALTDVEETWASRTVTYILTPTKTRLSALVPQGLSSDITVTVSAQLPSSVVTTFQLRGRCLRLEAHVLPETYATSRLTISAHHNFAVWASTGPFVRDMLTALSGGLRNEAEKRPVKQPRDMMFQKIDTKSEKLLMAFTKLRIEFNSLGFGVPAEFAASTNSVDM